MESKLSHAQRAADVVTEFCGSWTFIAIGSILTGSWILYNAGNRAFDPYPYILFNLVLTVVSTFQSPLIMMSQNRQIERDKLIAQEQAERLHNAVQGLHDKLDGRQIPPTIGTRLQPVAFEQLADFAHFCASHPDLRFWQALNAWAGTGKILAVSHSEDYSDTFAWKGRNA